MAVGVLGQGRGVGPFNDSVLGMGSGTCVMGALFAALRLM